MPVLRAVSLRGRPHLAKPARMDRRDRPGVPCRHPLVDASRIVIQARDRWLPSTDRNDREPSEHRASAPQRVHCHDSGATRLRPVSGAISGHRWRSPRPWWRPVSGLMFSTTDARRPARMSGRPSHRFSRRRPRSVFPPFASQSPKGIAAPARAQSSTALTHAAAASSTRRFAGARGPAHTAAQAPRAPSASTSPDGSRKARRVHRESRRHRRVPETVQARPLS